MILVSDIARFIFSGVAVNPVAINRVICSENTIPNPVITVTIIRSIVNVTDNSFCVSSRDLISLYSVNTGTNDADTDPSPKRRLNKFGIRYAA